jgi:hypothetical protein
MVEKDPLGKCDAGNLIFFCFDVGKRPNLAAYQSYFCLDGWFS